MVNGARLSPLTPLFFALPSILGCGPTATTTSAPAAAPAPRATVTAAPARSGPQTSVEWTSVQENGAVTAIHGAGRGQDSAKVTEAGARCDGGDFAGCHALGLALMTPADKEGENNPRAAAAFEKACKGGYAPSCNGLGVMYAQGMGVGRDEARAVELQEGACKGGVSTACLHVAYAYEGGRGVGANPVKMIDFYELACGEGATEGCQRAGAAYAKGEGVPKDPARARRSYERGCKEGSREACDELGKLPGKAPR